MPNISEISLLGADGVYDILDKNAVHGISVNGIEVSKDASLSVDIELEHQNAYSAISPTGNQYVYEISYENIDYDYAYEHLKNPAADEIPSIGACSSFKVGNWYARNFDFFYNRSVEFVVRIPRIGDRYASIGVANYSRLTTDIVSSGAFNVGYKILPFFTMDGENEYHLACNTNVVPKGDAGEGIPTTGNQHPDAKANVPMIMLPRYVLDHYRTADEAVADIRDHINVYDSELLPDYELHIMIADELKAYVVEFIDNECHITETDVMTNLYNAPLHDLVDGKIVRNTDSSVNQCGVTPHGCGIERYNILREGISAADSYMAVKDLIQSVKYTQTYTITDPDKIWYTELVGGNRTVTSPDEDFAQVIEIARERYAHATRDDDQSIALWHTMHSSIYDLQNRRLYLAFQEMDTDLDTIYEFDFERRELPEYPIEDGEYSLVCKVVDGKIGLEWIK